MVTSNLATAFTCHVRLRGAPFGAFAVALLALPGLSQQPDLRVLSVDDSGISGNWQSLHISGSLGVLVENAGDAGAGAPFNVVAYADENGNGQYDAGIDTLLGAGSLPDLASTAQQSLALSISGSVHFREDLIIVALDTTNAIAESNETNNQMDSGFGCTINVPPGAINPVLEWSWTSSAVEPGSLNVMMTPAVLDVNGDSIPDVVFASTESTGGGYIEVGLLRALSGANGAELWNVTDPTLRVNTAYNVAAGDIDGDGLPEIIACDESGQQLICFENDGTFKWRSAVLEWQYWGGAAIADLDGDGNPEIVTGRQVLDHDGNLLWTGAGGAGTSGTGPLSIVCDFDLDGVPDIICGNTVYTAAGAILCDDPSLPDGYNAVANFDGDPEPELVLVAGGYMYLLERDPVTPTSLRTIWGPVLIAGGGGGPPTIADYDGDGLPEIAVAGASAFAVYESDGTLKWEAVTSDTSSYVTGSSVFDFNGDGSAEVIYRDQNFLRIYDGPTGNVLFQTPMSSCTWHEYVIVVDVDGDGNSEIVACANNNCGWGPEQGIFVFKDQNDDWVPTRRIWNQYSYHITNVEENGAIPLVENDNWLYPAGLPFNNYRQNQLSTVQPNGAPDLTACRIVVTPASAPDTLVARIGNAGSAFVGAGIPVSFYDGDPSAGGVLLGTIATSIPLTPGAWEDVSLYVGAIPGIVFVNADDAGYGAGTENECDETNNLHSVAVKLTAPAIYCEGKVNSAGCMPSIGFSGTSSASEDSGFFVSCTNAINNKNGLLFYKAPGNRSHTAFQCSVLCLGPGGIRRTPSRNSFGSPPPNNCSGVWSLDMNCFAAGACGGVPAPAMLVPGTMVNCQWWGRDPGFAAPCNTQLSNGLEYFIRP